MQNRKIRFIYALCALFVLICGGGGVFAPYPHAWGAGGDLLWEVPSGGALAASQGRVVVTGSTGVQAFDGATGGSLWHDGFFGATTVAMDGQQVIAGGSTAIRAYESKTGALQWESLLPPGTTVRSVVLQGNQFFLSGITMGAAGDLQILVRAYMAKTGAIQWEDRSLPDGASVSPFFAPTQKGMTVRGNRVYIVASVFPVPVSCLVRAYDRMTGQIIWDSVSQETCWSRAVAASGQQVILAAAGGSAADDFMVRTYSAETGDLLWQDRTNIGTGFDNQAVAVDEEGKRAYVAGWVLWLPGMLNQEAFLVRAYDTKTGQLFWEDQYPGSVRFCRCHARDIVVEQGKVFAVGIVPFVVRAYDAKEGTLVWQNELSTGRAESVAFDRGIVFVADQSLLRAYEAK